VRRLLLVVGVLGAGGGVVLVVRPDLAGFGETSLLAVLGVLALVQVVRVAMGRKSHAPSLVETPDPETEQELSVPGEDLDEALAAIRRTPPRRATRRVEKRRSRRRESIRDRIEAAAVQTIVRQHGVSAERARRVLETGAWTDDPDAAAFFTGEIEVGRAERLRRALSRTPPFRRRAERAAAAVADLAAAERVAGLEPVGSDAGPRAQSSSQSQSQSRADDGRRREGSS